MAITSIPTEKIGPGRVIRAEILESTMADGNHVDVGQIVTISREAFLTLRAYGKARLAPPEEIPVADPAPTKAEPRETLVVTLASSNEPLAEVKPKGRWGRK